MVMGNLVNGIVAHGPDGRFWQMDVALGCGVQVTVLAIPRPAAVNTYGGSISWCFMGLA